MTQSNSSIPSIPSIPPQPLREYALQLSDNRQLGVAEFGAPDGKPVLWFHGTPGARRQVPFAARQYALTNGLRIIGIERPGIGLSTQHLYPNIAAWASDMEEFADRLALDHFGLIGLSGGGPYVLATAHHLPDRVSAGAIFGGVAPTHGEEAPEGGLTALGVPAEKALNFLKKPLGSLLSGTVLALHPFANAIFDAIVKYVPGHETEMLAQPELRDMFLDDLLRGSKTGMRATLNDIILFARPWGFELSTIKTPIHFWQGTIDPLVPVSHAQTMAGIIPGAGYTLCENEGHLAGLDRTIDALEFIRQQN
jgi:pimeloyl-ACP methyl ester carboxylesterase